MTLVASPDTVCFCGHTSRQHALPVNGSACAVVERYAPGTNRAIRCWCDGFFPRP